MPSSDDIIYNKTPKRQRMKKAQKHIRPGKNLAELRKLLNAYHDFLDAFEMVFHLDWETTRGNICKDFYISPSGTFIEPGFSDEANNWAERGRLLACYRDIKALLGERQIQSAILRDAAQEPSEPDATTEIGDLDF